MSTQLSNPVETAEDASNVISGRRRFLKAAGMAAAGAALPVGAAAWASPAAAQSTQTTQGGGVQPYTMKTRKLGSLEVSELGFGCMSISGNYGPPADQKQGIEVIRDAYEARRHVLRHRRGLWPLHERGTRRRSTGAGPRQGRHRDQVRLRDRRHDRVGQPTGAHPRVVEESLKRLRTDRIDLYYQHRVDLDRADRGRGWHGQGSDQGRKGPALRPLGAECENHSPRACGSTGCRHPDRILAHRKKPGTQRRASSV